MAHTPLVLGSSFTGLLVSHALARQGIAHTVIGGPRPPVSPRLDESVSEGAALACWDLLGPVYRPFFHEKSHISLACGELASRLDLAEPGRDLDDLRRLDPLVARRADVAARVVHLDRARLDPMLYDEVREHPACSFIEARVRRVEYHAGMDRMDRVLLDDGRIIVPSVVFDATGYRGVVAEAVHLGHRSLSRLRRAVWLHRYRVTPSDPRPWPWWRHGTNFARLQRQHDGIDGVAWMIPLGDEVSLGLEVDARTNGADLVGDAMLVDALTGAYRRRGMDITRVYPRAGSVRHLTHRYYLRERGYGVNWMLAGSSFGRLWFPTSTSVTASAMAAYLAPSFLHDPAGVGSRYEAWFRGLLPLHHLVGNLVDAQAPVHVHELHRFWARWRRYTLARLPEELRIAGGGAPCSPTRWRALPGSRARSDLAMLAARGFATISAQRVDDPQQWAELFADDQPSARPALRRYARGWAAYLGSVAAQAWRGESSSGFLRTSADGSSAVTMS